MAEQSSLGFNMGHYGWAAIRTETDGTVYVELWNNKIRAANTDVLKATLEELGWTPDGPYSVLISNFREQDIHLA